MACLAWARSGMPGRACTILVVVWMARLASAQQPTSPWVGGNAALAWGEAQQPSPWLGDNPAPWEAPSPQETQPYTIKSGDFKVLLVPSMAASWNDNINLSRDNRLDDFILSPQLQVDATYPFSQRNLLRLSVGVGYDKYINHDDFSGVRLFSGSEVSFEVNVKDFWINIHDQFSYTEDTAGQAAVAGSGRYGGLNNAAGLSVTWDLHDVMLTAGYDHLNFVSSSSEFDYANEATELVTGRAALALKPGLTAGLEGTVSFTAYDQPILNNNTGYNLGVFADWKPGTYFEVKPRVGYTIYQFEQTSQLSRAENQDAWYLDLTVTHAPSDAFRYSLSAGHELRLGIQADTVEAWYVRPSVEWQVMKHLTLFTYVSYENGRQALSDLSQTQSGLSEHYNWLGLGIGVTRPLTDRLGLSLDYRSTLRSSDIQSREYTQNLISLRLTYQIK